MLDFAWTADASLGTIAALALLSLLAGIMFGWRLVTIVGNHIVHRLDQQIDLLRDLKRLLEKREDDG